MDYANWSDINWSDPEFPQPCDHPGNATPDVVILTLLRHHLEIIKAHCHAIERLLTSVQS